MKNVFCLLCFSLQVLSHPLLSWWLALKSELGRVVRMFLRAKTRAPKPQMILLQRIRGEGENQNPNLVIYLTYFRHHEILKFLITELFPVERASSLGMNEMNVCSSRGDIMGGFMDIK